MVVADADGNADADVHPDADGDADVHPDADGYAGPDADVDGYAQIRRDDETDFAYFATTDGGDDMDHHPNRTRGARHADGPDYTTAYLVACANGATDADMDAYLEAAKQAHADAGNRGAAGNDFAEGADTQAGDPAMHT